jgi:hypothetical protein
MLIILYLLFVNLAIPLGRRCNAAIADSDKFQGWPIYSHGYFTSEFFSDLRFTSWKCIQKLLYATAL